jgi:hypothetical protein
MIYNHDNRQYNKIMALIGHDYEIFPKTFHERDASETDTGMRNKCQPTCWQKRQ